MRIRKSKKNRQHNGPKDTKGVMRINLREQTTQCTKGVMRIRKSKKNRQHNGQKIPKG